MIKTKMRRAPNPTWLKPEDLHRLEDFITLYGGTLRVHNHLKTIRRW